MHFTINDIKEMAPGATFDRGLQYFHGRQATITGNFPEESRFTAQVQGSGRNVYWVHVSFDTVLMGDCSCPVGIDCKHAVAAALQWLKDGGASQKQSEVQLDVQDTGVQKPTVKKPGAGTTHAFGMTRHAPTLIELWLSGLPTAVKQPANELNSGQHYLLYELVIVRQEVRLGLKKGYLKKGGNWSQVKNYGPDYYALEWKRQDLLQPLDVAILQLLPQIHAHTTAALGGEAARRALELMLTTRRFFHAGKPVTRGPAQAAQWHWEQRKDQYELQARIEGRDNWMPIATSPMCYLDLASAELGELTTPLSSQQFAYLRSMPPVPVGAMTEVALQLRQFFKPEELSVPVEVPEIIEANQPVPCLTIVAAHVYPDTALPAALLHYEYANEICDPIYVPGSRIIQEPRMVDGKYLRIERDIRKEDEYTHELSKLGLNLYSVMAEHQHVWSPPPGAPAMVISFWEHFLTEQVPALEAQGWRISVRDDVNLTVTDAAFDFSLQDESSHWFELALTLPLSGDRQLNTAAVVEMWLHQGAPEELMVNVEGEWLRIDTKPLTTIRDLITELFQRKQLHKPVRLAAFQVAQLQDIPNLDYRAAPLTRKLLQQLQDFRGIESVAVSPRLQATLRPYQQEGLDWLVFLHRYSLGGILADDMGLGKTLQALALLQHLKDNNGLNKPALIIAPTSLTGNWMHEAARFTPDLNVTLIHGPERAAAFKQIKRSDVVITTYPLLLRDSKQYEKLTFSLLILDEAQAIKNPTTKIFQCVRQLRGQMRLCMTGTPLENHLGELWALMDFVLPGLLSGRTTFQKQYRNPIEKNGDIERQQALGRRVAPFMLRRTKNQVATELPAKTEIIQYVELEGKQRALYESIRVSMEKRIRDLVATQGMQRSHIQFLDALLKLRQACIDPRLVKLDKSANIQEHAKLEWLNETLPQLLEEGRHILIFSQFTEVLALIEEDLEKQKITYTKLTGKTRKRQEAIDLFQSGAVRVFLISLKAGGSGLNLTAADVVIHMDPWWNPAVENQATDRAHRIGQDKPVFVYKLVAADTVEERIQQMQQQKQALADNLFNETGSLGQAIDKEALLGLLAS